MPGIVHVVDDDALLRTTIRQLAEAAGHRVITYASAQQLLDQRPDENSPGCILLDVRMPGLSGPELQNRLADGIEIPKLPFGAQVTGVNVQDNSVILTAAVQDLKFNS